MATTAVAIRIGLRSRTIIAMASFIGVVAFLWPFVVAPGRFGDTSMAPLMFGALLVLALSVDGIPCFLAHCVNLSPCRLITWFGEGSAEHR